MIQDKQKKVNRESGFTIVELSMALIFIAFIILFLSSTLINIMATYNTGIWLNQVNAATRQINADLANQTRFGATARVASTGDRLCVGNVAYFWNVGDDDRNSFTGSNPPQLRLVRATNPNPVNNVDYCNNPDEQPDRNHASVQTLLSASVDLLRFDVTQNDTQDLIKFDIVIATSGNNRPLLRGDGSYTCEDGGVGINNFINPFCAFTDLSFTVFNRNR